MIIAAGSDHAGYDLKIAIASRLRALGHQVVDVGTTNSQESVDYPVFAHQVASMVENGQAERGLLICGTGIGMSMAANRHQGVRAAECVTPHMAEMARSHNDANVLCMGARLLTEDEAWAITETWLVTPFEGGRHERRVALIELPVADRA